MLTYSFTNIGSESLYQHLYQCIRNDVVSGILPPGTKMPSKRSFALHLGISVMTVESAYSQLVAEGYLYSLPRKGFYVADVRSQKPQVAADVALFRKLLRFGLPILSAITLNRITFHFQFGIG